MSNTEPACKGCVQANNNKPLPNGYTFYNNIGPPQFICAPIVQQSELPFRLLCPNNNAPLCYSPMMNGLHYITPPIYQHNAPNTCAMVRPLIAQFCGHLAPSVLAAAKMIDHQIGANGAAVDSNLGCPQNTSGNYGALLLTQVDPRTLCELVRMLSQTQNLSIPACPKLPIVDDEQETSVHGRTSDAKTSETGDCDPDIIPEIKQTMDIPLLANEQQMSMQQHNAQQQQFNSFIQCLMQQSPPQTEKATCAASSEKVYASSFDWPPQIDIKPKMNNPKPDAKESHPDKLDIDFETMPQIKQMMDVPVFANVGHETFDDVKPNTATDSQFQQMSALPPPPLPPSLLSSPATKKRKLEIVSEIVSLPTTPASKKVKDEKVKHEKMKDKKVKFEACEPPRKRPRLKPGPKRKGEAPHIFKCSFCGKLCTSSYKLTRHERTHTGEKPFQCELCGYRCARKDHLLQHTRTHTGEKPHKCTFCSYATVYSQHLKTHMNKHTGKQPYECRFCHRHFSQSSNRTAHVQRKHQEELATFGKKYCYLNPVKDEK